jgi:hypothetical protein
MTATLNLKGWGGLIVLVGIGVIVGALIYTSPEMVQPWINTVLERPLVSGGFGLLLVVLILFGNGPPGDDGTV